MTWRGATVTWRGSTVKRPIVDPGGRLMIERIDNQQSTLILGWGRLLIDTERINDQHFVLIVGLRWRGIDNQCVEDRQSTFHSPHK